MDILDDLEILILQNEDDFDRGSGKYILRQFIEEKKAEQLKLCGVGTSFKECEAPTFNEWLTLHRYVQFEDTELYKTDEMYFNKADLENIYKAYIETL